MANGARSHATNTPPRHASADTRTPRRLVVVLAVLLTIGGLFLFTHTQTQALFNDAQTDLTSTQSPRNDAGMLLGALMSGSGIALLLSHLSPLHRTHRILPALVLGSTSAALMAAHFSIFTNGLTFPDQRGVAVQSAFLFHDTAATIPLATFTLAFLTLIVLIIAGLSLLALIAPRVLNQHVLKPKTLHAHRVRLFIITLLFLGIASTFARGFILLGIDAGTAPITAIYLLMGLLLAALLVSITWRSSLLLWGRLDTRLTHRFKTGHRLTLYLEGLLWIALLGLTGLTLLADPVYEPAPGTDPVFAINSIGLSWVFLLAFGIYLLQRRTTHTYTGYLPRLGRPFPHLRGDRLLAFGAITITMWTLGALWHLHPGLNPLSVFALRLLPIVLIAPLFALKSQPRTQTTPHQSTHASPLLLFAGGTLSILTGIMLWGIGNSASVVFLQSSGGFQTSPARLMDPTTGAIRLLGSLLIAAPLGSALAQLTRRRQHKPSRLLLITATTGLVFTMNVLLTIEPGTRYNPALGHTDVLVGFWAASLATPYDMSAMATMIALVAATALLATTRQLHRGIDPTPTGLPTPDWQNLGVRLPRPQRRSRALHRRSSAARSITTRT